MDNIDFNEPVWGKDIFDSIRGTDKSIMAANIRTKASVEGVMSAALKTDSAVLFEIAMSEVGYTDQKPQEFIDMIKSEAKRLGFTQPYAIHADHITIKDNSQEAFEKAKALLEAQIDAGFTSFAIDASHNFDVNAPNTGEALRDNIDITTRLAKIIQERAPRASLEVEVGEIGHKDSKTGEQETTTVDEAVTFVKALKANGIQPDLLAIHNGTAHGNAFDAAGNPVPQLGIDLKRTREIADAIAGEGLVGITQHGTTGTSPENMSLLPDAFIRKVNVATHFQNVVLDKIPAEMRERMEEFVLTTDDATIAKERAKEEGKLASDMDSDKRRTVLISKLIKRANGPFKSELHSLATETQAAITEQTNTDCLDFFQRFRSVGTGQLVKDHILQEAGRQDLKTGLEPPKGRKEIQ